MGTIHKALKIRIYPSQEQETQILKTIGSCRFLYNNMLAEKLKTMNLGKSVMDLGYSSFVNQLKYKSLWNNKIFIQADKWFASSKTCSVCGYRNKDLQLSDRNWEFPNCGIHHDRDQNVGINLKNYGLKELGMGQPENKPVESKTSGFEQSKLSLDVEAGRLSLAGD